MQVISKPHTWKTGADLLTIKRAVLFLRKNDPSALCNYRHHALDRYKHNT